MEKFRYSEEELEQIGRFKGRCHGLFLKHEVDQMGNQLHDAVYEFEGIVNGLFDVFSE